MKYLLHTPDSVPFLLVLSVFQPILLFSLSVHSVMNITVGNITTYQERRNTALCFPFMSEPDNKLLPYTHSLSLCTLITPTLIWHTAT